MTAPLTSIDGDGLPELLHHAPDQDVVVPGGGTVPQLELRATGPSDDRVRAAVAAARNVRQRVFHVRRAAPHVAVLGRR